LCRRGQQPVDVDAAFIRTRSRYALLIPRVRSRRRAISAMRRDPFYDDVDRVESDYYRFRNLTGG
jgi:hypothetical protein